MACVVLVASGWVLCRHLVGEGADSLSGVCGANKCLFLFSIKARFATISECGALRRWRRGGIPSESEGRTYDIRCANVCAARGRASPSPCTPNPSGASLAASGSRCSLSGWFVLNGGSSVAIYHFTTQSISGGRSAVAAAAYRAGDRLEDRNTGEVHDYRRRGGIEREDCEVLVPAGAPEWAKNRQELWNHAQDAERTKSGDMRKNARVAREWEVSLPHELTREQRRELGRELGEEIVKRYGVAVQLDFHAPGSKGDNRNHHIHVQATSRELGREGFGQKASYDRADRDLKAEGLPNGKAQLNDLRKTWADMANRALERAGHDVRIDHRSLADQRESARERGDVEKARDLDREPTRHMGPAATAMERGKPLYRNGEEVPDRWRREPRQTELGDTNRRIELAAELGKIQREKASVGRSIIDTESSIADAIKERNSQFRDFLKDQRDNAGSRGTQKAPERHDWSHMRELAGARGTDRKNEREATPESIEAAIRGYAAQTGQQAPRNSLQERFGHLTKGQAQTEPEKRLEGPQREREAPQIITDPSAALAPRPSLADRFGHLVKEQPKREAETRLILPERMGGSTTPPKEKTMEREASGQQANREEGAALRRMDQQQQQAPKQEQEQPRESQQQEQQNRLKQIAAQMEQQRMERERQKQQERERSGPDLSL